MRSSTNILLAKDDVGKSKPSTRDLPQGNHIFGLPHKVDAVGVRGCKYRHFFEDLTTDLLSSDLSMAYASDEIENGSQ